MTSASLTPLRKKFPTVATIVVSSTETTCVTTHHVRNNNFPFISRYFDFIARYFILLEHFWNAKKWSFPLKYLLCVISIVFVLTVRPLKCNRSLHRESTLNSKYMRLSYAILMFSILGHTSIPLAFENPEASLHDPICFLIEADWPWRITCL